MKKIFAILMVVLLLASALCIPAYAEESGTIVVDIKGLKEDGTIVTLNHWTKFDDGWECAVDFAKDEDFMEKHGLVRIIFSLNADWTAKKGVFGDSDLTGFQFSTIYVPAKAPITMDLNGHTINRGKESYEYDGEVICVEKKGNLIINNGTIKGGWSCNGAGGIHIEDNAKVVLNDVHIVGNVSEDDDGGGLAVYNGATLIMNGGSITNNSVKSTNVSWVFGGGIYIEESTASFYNVTFKNNHSKGQPDYNRDQSETYSSYGAAIYADESDITIDTCYFYDNGYQHGNFLDTESIIYVEDDSNVTIKNTIFSGNGAVQHFTNGQHSVFLTTKLFHINYSDVTIEKCQFNKNNTSVMLDVDSGTNLNVTDTHFTDNNSSVYYGSVSSSNSSSFVNCTFDRNGISVKYDNSFEFAAEGNQPIFADCVFGNSSFNDRSKATFLDTDMPGGAASIFGEGSLSMIISLLALVVSIAAIGVSIASRQKKTEETEE